jgi:hypothetical protein
MFKSKGRLGPGKMVAIDLHTGELIENEAVKQKPLGHKQTLMENCWSLLRCWMMLDDVG